MTDNDSYQNRLKKMKKSIDQNKDVLNENFPDNITYSGDPELIKKDEDDIDKENSCKEGNKNVKQD